MKIRQDFVTNSSSTSFVISMKKEINEQNFLRAIGADRSSAMKKIFEDLYVAIDKKKEDINLVINESRCGHNAVEDFLKAKSFDDDTINIVKKLLEQGRIVYYGTLGSDGDSVAERYFCTESFLICDDNIYFNGQIKDW